MLIKGSFSRSCESSSITDYIPLNWSKEKFANYLITTVKENSLKKYKFLTNVTKMSLFDIIPLKIQLNNELTIYFVQLSLINSVNVGLG